MEIVALGIPIFRFLCYLFLFNLCHAEIIMMDMV